MKNSMIDQFLKNGIKYRGVIVREPDGLSVHLNYNNVPAEQFGLHVVQILNAKNDALKLAERVSIVEEFNLDKAELLARMEVLFKQTGLTGVCKARCKPGAVK